MPKWLFQVPDGTLSTLPESLKPIVAEQKAVGAWAFFVSEAGTLLNEPDDRIVVSMPQRAQAATVIVGVSEAMAWIFDKLEVELDQDFQHNYLKISFVNLNPLHSDDVRRSGRMSTIFPELPENMEVSAQMQLHQMTTAIRLFFSHMRAAVELGGWGWDTLSCDWVSMTFNKSQ